MATTAGITLRSVEPDEVKQFLTTVEAAFGESLNDEDAERWSTHIEPERQFWAWDGDVPVGTAGTFALRVRVPGAELPADGITAVGVQPSHRRRGILTQMMRRQLEDAREHEEPVAILWASEGSIYGRFGYGVATVAARLEADRDRTVFRQPDEPVGTTRLVTDEQALQLFPPIYDRVQAATAGMLARGESWWKQTRLADPEHWRRGAGPMFRVVWENDGRPEAYAMYRLRGSWDDGVPGGSLEVREAVGVSPLATREIFRFLLGVDLHQRVKCWNVPPDHPLFLSVTEPRRLKIQWGDGLWVRLLDLDASLSARSYAADGAVTFEIRDAFWPENEGTWRLEVEGGQGSVTRNGGDPELRLDVADLGSAYLGGFSFASLQRARRVEEVVEGAVERADSLFRTSAQPWCAEVF
jgi:predicted acetyltransferase